MPSKKAAASGAKGSSKKKSADRGRIATLASVMPELAADEAPPVLGSRVRIWKQDPSVRGLDVRPAYIHTRIDDGPSDSQIRIQGLPKVTANVNGDFLFEPSAEEAFDAVHTYAVVRQTLTMYQRLMSQKIGWQWNTGNNRDPIDVFPHGGEGANAFYSRTDRELRFFSFTPPGSDGQRVFTARSLDIVAHEAGHGVLDSLKPAWLLSSSPPQTGGLHESFGDLTAIFLTLSQLDQVEFIIAETKADLHQKNVLAAVAEEFGSALGRPTGLRNADNDLKLSEVSSEVHEISKVFTGGVYDILADAFTANRDSRKRDDAAVLYEVGQKVANLTIRGIKNSPNVGASYSDVVNEMIAIADAEPDEFAGFSAFIRKHFEFREVIGPSAAAGPTPLTGFAASRSGCCATMRRPEYDDVE